jgi:hypothetical protein
VNVYFHYGQVNIFFLTKLKVAKKVAKKVPKKVPKNSQKVAKKQPKKLPKVSKCVSKRIFASSLKNSHTGARFLFRTFAGWKRE